MFIKIYLFFFIYAFLGWCTEVVYAALTVGKFINRGFLNGPLCPIYGFGVIAVVNFLMPVNNNLFLLFVGSIFITSVIELITGFILEKMFHHKWWDYSDRPFNIGGYICPLFSLMWGIACLIVVDKIHPMVSELVYFIPDTAAIAFLAIMSIILLIDLIATVNTIFKLNKKLEHIEELSAMIKKSSDEIGENLAAGAMVLKGKIEHREQAIAELKKANRELLEASIFGQKRLFNAFPGLKSTRHKEALKALKDYVLKKQ
ncbi:MAG: hypothetical protein PHE29_00860 [Tissierellia bacterium]|nr:hypothetical protein [Tissierellia bacterium]MDD4780532.1 hypothetical protein [Tissierellia bacterium]